MLVWVVGGVADNGGWVPCGLGFSEQWNVQREFRRKFGDDRQRGAAHSRRVGQIAGVRTQHQPGAEPEEGPQEADCVLRECCVN